MSAGASRTDLDELELRLHSVGLEPTRGHHIGALTTYRVGGAAALFVEPAAPGELIDIGRARSDLDVEVLVIGRGSNMLVADTGFAGLALRLTDSFDGIAVDEDGVTVRVGGAASMPIVARRTAALGLRGFEWAVGVPGSIGGAVRMNAGGHGSDMAAVLEGVRVVDLTDGEAVEMETADLALAYRHSAIGPTQVVTEATIVLAPGDAIAAEAQVSEIVRWRRAHQPGGTNAGSVFTNPAGDSAGRLIDTAGCRGLRIGSAEVSEKHANFIQADSDGTAGDVAALMTEVRRRVLERHGVELHAETIMVGFDDEVVQAAGGRR